MRISDCNTEAYIFHARSVAWNTVEAKAYHQAVRDLRTYDNYLVE